VWRGGGYCCWSWWSFMSIRSYQDIMLWFWFVF
jgi:hypothetical protein